ncbi:hypothetical protein ACFQU7_18470 [Pseudoroseomonas wenyumeiae]
MVTADGRSGAARPAAFLARAGGAAAARPGTDPGPAGPPRGRPPRPSAAEQALLDLARDAVALSDTLPEAPRARLRSSCWKA